MPLPEYTGTSEDMRYGIPNLDRLSKPKPRLGGIDPVTGLPRMPLTPQEEAAAMPNDPTFRTPDQMAAEAAMKRLDEMGPKTFDPKADSNARASMMQKSGQGPMGQRPGETHMQVNPGYRSGLTGAQEKALPTEIQGPAMDELKKAALERQANQRPMYMRMNGQDYYGYAGAHGNAQEAKATAARLWLEHMEKKGKDADTLAHSRGLENKRVPYEVAGRMADHQIKTDDDRYKENAASRQLDLEMKRAEIEAAKQGVARKTQEMNQAPFAEDERRKGEFLQQREEINEEDRYTDRGSRDRYNKLSRDAGRTEQGRIPARVADAITNRFAPAIKNGILSGNSASVYAAVQQANTQLGNMDPADKAVIISQILVQAAQASGQYGEHWFSQDGSELLKMVQAGFLK